MDGLTGSPGITILVSTHIWLFYLISALDAMVGSGKAKRIKKDIQQQFFYLVLQGHVLTSR